MFLVIVLLMVPGAAVFFHQYNLKVSLAIEQQMEKRKSLNKIYAAPLHHLLMTEQGAGLNAIKHSRSDSQKSVPSTISEGNTVIETPYPKVTESLETLLHLINRDFIDSWADPLCPDKRISAVTRDLMRSLIVSLSHRMEKLDLVNLIVIKAVPILTSHFMHVRLAEGSVKTSTFIDQRRKTMTPGLAITLKYEKLHRALSPNSDDTETEKAYLKSIAKKLIPSLVPESESGSAFVCVLLREVLVNTILFPIIEYISDPDYLNQTIEIFSRKAIHDLNMVKKLREALDRPFTPTQTPVDRGQDKPRTFDEFLAGIKECNNVADAKRIRNHIVAEIRKRRVQTKGHKKGDIVNGKKVSDLEKYINRLYVAKKRAEKQITALGGNVYKTRRETFSKGKIETTLIGFLNDEASFQVFRDYLMNDYRQVEKLNLYLATRDLSRTLTNPSSDHQVALVMTEAFMDAYLKKTTVMAIPPRLVKEFASSLKTFKSNPEIKEYLLQIVGEIQKIVLESLDNAEFVSFCSSDAYYHYLNNPASFQSKRQTPDDTQKIKKNGKSPMKPTESVDFNPSSTDEFDGVETISEDELLPTDAVEKVEAEFEAILSKENNVPNPVNHNGEDDDVEDPEAKSGNSDAASDGSTLLKHRRNESISSESSTSHFKTLDPLSKGDDQNASALIKKEIEETKSRIDVVIQQLTLCDLMENGKKINSSGRRLIGMSKKNLKRELKILQFQRQQLELELNQVFFQPGLFSVSIPNTSVQAETLGKNVSLYVIQVNKFDPSNLANIIAGWMVARRYSEFHTLHQKLKEMFPIVEGYGFPGKSVRNLFKDSPEFVEERREALEKYIKTLSKNLNICQSKEFRAFMCQQELSMDEIEALTSSKSKNTLSSKKRSNFVKTIREESMFDEVLEKLSSSLRDEKEKQAEGDSNESGNRSSMVKENRASDLAEQLGDALEENEVLMGIVPGEVPAEDLSLPVSKAINEPLIDLFVELFDLRDRNNWLRRRAVQVILQQILGGTIERIVTENIKFITEEEMLLYYLSTFKQGYWPDGKWNTDWPERTSEQKIQTAAIVERHLHSLLPELLGGVVGRRNAKVGAQRIFQTLQYQKLNRHVLYNFLDQILITLFPDIEFSSLILE